MSKDSLARLKAAESFFRERNQTEMADQLARCVMDIQSLHHALQKETQALLHGTAPALSQNAESTLKNCDAKLAEMTAAYETSWNTSMASALARMDQEIEVRASETKLGEQLIRTIKTELPDNLTASARKILMEEAGPVWTQRWMVAMAAMLLVMVLILGAMFFGAQKATSQIEQRAAELTTLQQRIHKERATLATLNSQTMGIAFYRMETGMALKLPDTLRLKPASADVRNALGNTSRRNLYWITER